LEGGGEGWGCYYDVEKKLFWMQIKLEKCLFLFTKIPFILIIYSLLASAWPVFVIKEKLRK
jgi:hypothetical protein